MTGFDYLVVFTCVWGGSNSFLLALAAVFAMSAIEDAIKKSKS